MIRSSKFHFGTPLIPIQIHGVAVTFRGCTSTEIQRANKLFFLELNIFISKPKIRGVICFFFLPDCIGVFIILLRSWFSETNWQNWKTMKFSEKLFFFWFHLGYFCLTKYGLQGLFSSTSEFYVTYINIPNELQSREIKITVPLIKLINSNKPVVLMIRGWWDINETNDIIYHKI